MAALLALAGCGSLFGSSERKPPCPRIGILADTAQIVQFRPGAGRDLTDIQYRGEIAGFTGGCEFADKNNRVTVTLELRIVAERGPAAADPVFAAPYFVAIADRNQTILAKEVFETRIELGNRPRAGVAEELVQQIPLGGGRSSNDVEILVGFQLTEAQLDFNRRRRGF